MSPSVEDIKFFIVMLGIGHKKPIFVKLDDGETDPNQQMIFSAELNDSDFVGTISGPPIGDGYFNGYAISEGN